MSEWSCSTKREIEERGGVASLIEAGRLAV